MKNKLFMSVLAYIVMSRYYNVIRYAGNLIQIDSAANTKAIQSMTEIGTIYPLPWQYSYGFAYQLLITTLSHVTGIQLQYIQLYFSSLLGALPILLSYYLLLQFTNDRKIAAFSFFLVSLQPDLLFVTQRSTHESVTFSLFFILLIFVLRQMSVNSRSNSIVILIATLGIIASNLFYATGYLFIIVTSLFFTFAISWYRKETLSIKALSILKQRSTYTFVVLFVMMFFVYPPAIQQLYVFNSTMEQLGMLLFGFPEGYSAELHVQSFVWRCWKSIDIWILLQLFNITLIPLAIYVWIRNLYVYIKRKNNPRKCVVLISFSLGMAVATIGALLVDEVRGLGAFSNVIVRVLPLSAPFVALLSGSALVWFVRKFKDRFILRNISKLAIVCFLIALVILGFMKASNEPAFAGKFVFYTSTEKNAIFWITEHASDQYKISFFPDDRIYALYLFVTPLKTQLKIDSVGDIYFSSTLHERAASAFYTTFDLPRPDFKNSSRLFDNGDSKFWMTP